MSGSIIFAPASSSFRRYRPGVWYGTAVPATVTNVAVAANTAYAFPIFIDNPVSIGQIGFQVGTPTPGVGARMALYSADDVAPVPENLLFGTLVDFDMGLAAGTVQALALPPNLQASRSLLFGVVKFSGAAQPRTLAATAQTTGPNNQVTMLWGSTSADAMVGASSANAITRCSAPALQGDPWPQSWPLGSWTLTASSPGSPVFAWSAA